MKSGPAPLCGCITKVLKSSTGESAQWLSGSSLSGWSVALFPACPLLVLTQEPFLPLGITMDPLIHLGQWVVMSAPLTTLGCTRVPSHSAS